MFPEPFRPRLLSIRFRREEACTYKNIRPAGTSRCIQPVYHHFALRPSNLLHRLPSIGDVQHKLYLLRFICVGFSLQKNQTMSLKLIQLYIRYFEICCEWIGLIMNNLLGDFHSPMPYFSEIINRYLLKFTMLTRWRYQHTWYLSVLGHHRIIKSCQNRPKSVSMRNKIDQSYTFLYKKRPRLEKAHLRWWWHWWQISTMVTKDPTGPPLLTFVFLVHGHGHRTRTKRKLPLFGAITLPHDPIFARRNSF